MNKWWFLAVFVPSNIAFAADSCPKTYTIGAYEQGIAQGAKVVKFGPLPAGEILEQFPQSFLEADGSYGGGKAFCAVQQACQTLQKLLAAGVLPSNENWHIYELAARWESDVYELHPGDFRVKRTVPVLGLAAQQCE